MSQDYSRKIDNTEKTSRSITRRVTAAVLLVLWVGLSFVVAQQLSGLLIDFLVFLKVPLAAMNNTILTTIFASVIYILAIGIAIGLPWLIKKDKISLGFLGINRLPNWMDIWTAPAGFVIYIIFSAILMALAMALLPWFDINQAQDVGFNSINFRYEYLLAFVTLIVIAPVAEETLFRGYLFGKLRKFMPLWVAILLTSVAFGAIHGAWNLALDTFALSVVLCVLRVVSGGLWAPILLHMIKNSIAFYILFINPTLFNTLGG